MDIPKMQMPRGRLRGYDCWPARRYRGSRSLLLWTAASVADALRKLNLADGRWQSVF